MEDRSEENIERLSEKHEALKRRITDLQEIEKYLFQQLQKANNEGGEDGAESIKKRIEQIVNIRTTLMSQLGEKYTFNQGRADKNRRHLADQSMIDKIMKEQNENLKLKLDEVKDEKLNRIKLAQISEYEYDRYKAHVKVMKIVLILLILIFVLTLMKRRFNLPTSMYTMIIFAIILPAFYSISIEMYTNSLRNNLDYDKFDHKLVLDEDAGMNKNNVDLSLSFGKLFMPYCQERESFSAFN